MSMLVGPLMPSSGRQGGDPTWQGFRNSVREDLERCCELQPR